MHCDIAAVTFICDHPDIRAISFVGSDRAVSYFFTSLLMLYLSANTVTAAAISEDRTFLLYK